MDCTEPPISSLVAGTGVENAPIECQMKNFPAPAPAPALVPFPFPFPAHAKAKSSLKCSVQ